MNKKNDSWMESNDKIALKVWPKKTEIHVSERLKA